MEMCFLRNQCWTLVSSPVPTDADQNVTWVTQDNWARGEIHLCYEPEVQEVIISSEHAYDSWSLLQSEFGAKGDLVVKRLRKEFSSVVMKEASCGEYIKRVRRLGAELGECGD